jgi:hypothetical protein
MIVKFNVKYLNLLLIFFTFISKRKWCQVLHYYIFNSELISCLYVSVMTAGPPTERNCSQQAAPTYFQLRCIGSPGTVLVYMQLGSQR